MINNYYYGNNITYFYIIIAYNALLLIMALKYGYFTKYASNIERYIWLWIGITEAYQRCIRNY